MDQLNFQSDNQSSAFPEIIDYLKVINQDSSPAYGADEVTKLANKMLKDVKIINRSVPSALKNLGYPSHQIEEIISHAVGHGTLNNAPVIKLLLPIEVNPSLIVLDSSLTLSNLFCLSIRK